MTAVENKYTRNELVSTRRICGNASSQPHNGSDIPDGNPYMVVDVGLRHSSSVLANTRFFYLVGKPVCVSMEFNLLNPR